MGVGEDDDVLVQNDCAIVKGWLEYEEGKKMREDTGRRKCAHSLIHIKRADQIQAHTHICQEG